LIQLLLNFSLRLWQDIKGPNFNDTGDIGAQKELVVKARETDNDPDEIGVGICYLLLIVQLADSRHLDVARVTPRYNKLLVFT
jgi:hypothetical protein